MDLLSGLISANAPVGQQNPVGNYATGASDALANKKAQIANVNDQYQQDLTMRLQKAINESIGANGMPDPVKMKQAGAKYGISPQMVNYAIDTMPKVWGSAKNILQSKNTIDAISPEAQKTLTNTWTSQPAKSSQSSATATAVPGAVTSQQQATATPTAQPQEDISGFTTHDMQQQPSGYKVSGAGISGQGQDASLGGLSNDPSALEGNQTDAQAAQSAQQMDNDTQREQSFFGQANAAQPETATPTEEPGEENPLQTATMTKWDKAAMMSQLQQEGRLGGKPTDKDLQAVLDSDYARIQATAGKPPSKRMYIDKDGNFDQGAYSRAQSEYSANLSKATSDFLKTEGGMYGQQFAQGMTKQANSRANQANQRAATDFAQQQEQIKELRAQGYNANAGNSDKLQVAVANKQSLENAKSEINELMPKAGKLDIDDFNSKIAVVEKAMSQAAGVSTEAAGQRLFSSFRADAALGAIARQSNSLEDFGRNFVSAKLGAQTQKQFLNLMESNIDAELKRGTNASYLQSNQLNWRQKPANKSGKGNTGGKTMSAADRLKAKFGAK